MNQYTRESSADERTNDRNGSIAPVRVPFARDGKDGMSDPRAEVARGINRIPRGATDGEADTPDQARY